MQSSQPPEVRSSESSQSFRAVVPPQHLIPEEIKKLGLQFRSGLRDRVLHPDAMQRAGFCLTMLDRLDALNDHPWIVRIENEVRNYAAKHPRPEEIWSRVEMEDFLRDLFQPAWCEDAVSPSVRGSSRPAPVLGYGQSAPTAALIAVMISAASIFQMQDRPLNPDDVSHPRGYYYINCICGADVDLVGARTDAMSLPQLVTLDHVLHQPYAEHANVKERCAILRLRVIKSIAAMALACGCPPSSSDGPPKLPEIS